MASGDLIVKVADKDTLDRTYANTNAILAAVGEDVRIKGVKRYGMKINKNDSNPATRCTYLFDAVGMTPAAMNYSAGRFDFGDWGNVFFVKNNYPAMVKYDGTEDYKLDPNDQRNCLLYLPKDLKRCRRGSQEETEMIADHIHSLICSTYGHTLVLFTSYVDDWMIAKLLGHTSIYSVHHYRKIGNKLMADETRAAREKMDMILLDIIEGWDDYEI